MTCDRLCGGRGHVYLKINKFLFYIKFRRIAFMWMTLVVSWYYIYEVLIKDYFGFPRESSMCIV